MNGFIASTKQTEIKEGYKLDKLTCYSYDIVIKTV